MLSVLAENVSKLGLENLSAALNGDFLDVDGEFRKCSSLTVLQANGVKS